MLSRLFAAFVFVVTCLDPVAFAAKPLISIVEDETALFNGRDLTGWVQVGGDPDRRGRFHVEDGAIVGTYVAGTSNTFLATEESYGDYVLEFEFMVSAGVNSGVQFRSTVRDKPTEQVSGYQFEIDTSPRQWSGGIYDEAGRGWLYPLEFNPAAKPLLRIGAWNQGRIECVGTSNRTWINKAPVAHLIDQNASEGIIALQVHGIGADSPLAGRTVRWRNLRLRAEPPSPTPPLDDLFIRNLIPDDLSEAETQQGWQWLFDGTSTAAWRGTRRTTFPTNGWRVEDGQLILASVVDAPGKDRGSLVTRESFASFELQLDVMLSPGANSGIKYFVEERADGGVLGLEYQILDDARHADAQRGVEGNRTMASLYDLIPSAQTANGRDVPRHVGTWNHVRIVAASDDQVQHWLNGFVVVEYRRGSEQYRSLVARSKYRTFDGFGLADAGPILLQDHQDEVRYQSVKIRRLDRPHAAE